MPKRRGKVDGARRNQCTKSLTTLHVQLKRERERERERELSIFLVDPERREKLANRGVLDSLIGRFLIF